MNRPLKTLKRVALIGAAILAFFYLPKGQADWQKPLQPPAPNPSDLTYVLSHPLEPSKILAASSHQLFENDPQSGHWKTLWSEGNSSGQVHRVSSFAFLPDHLFILTDQGVSMGDLKTGRWQKIYANRNGDTGNLLSFTVDPQDPNHWFLGTQMGLLESVNAGKVWSRSRYFTARHPVFILLFAADRLFIGGASALYVLKPSGEAQQAFTLPSHSGSSDLSPAYELPEGTSLEEETATSVPSELFDLIVSKSDSKMLWLGTAKGVFESNDRGFSWHALSSSGLQSTSVRQLVHSENANRLYAATPRGIYAFSPSRNVWEELFRGLANNDAESIALLKGTRETLAAITSEGLMQFPIIPGEIKVPGTLPPPAEILNLFRELVRLEPSARETHRAVIRYANVTNGKIKRWHVASRIAGLLPTFSYGKDFSTSNNVDLDRGGTSDPDRFISGPYDVSKGWDARVGWDLGDVIYSSDQTSIDSREKLMVELRNDLLSEATRLYYERRRLQIDFLFAPPVSEQEHLDSLLRIDELTALLDGMTDGFFSKRLDRVYNEKPELNKLWSFALVGEQKPNSTTLNAQRTT